MKPADTSSDAAVQPVENDDRSILAEPLSSPGFVRVQVDRTIIELTWNKDEVDELPEPLPFTEGTCEC